MVYWPAAAYILTNCPAGPLMGSRTGLMLGRTSPGSVSALSLDRYSIVSMFHLNVIILDALAPLALASQAQCSGSFGSGLWLMALARCSGRILWLWLLALVSQARCSGSSDSGFWLWLQHDALAPQARAAGFWLLLWPWPSGSMLLARSSGSGSILWLWLLAMVSQARCSGSSGSGFSTMLWLLWLWLLASSSG